MGIMKSWSSGGQVATRGKEYIIIISHEGF